MIKINCETKDTVKLTDMTPFQGSLKKRTEQDIEDLKQSLITEGLMMPFAIWVHEDKKYLLDGHGRKEALTRLAVDDVGLLSVDWPCIYIEAMTEDDARKALLQITSSYGKVTKSGYKQFCVSIPNYKAPVIAKFMPKPVKVKNIDKAKQPNATKTIIKVRVSNDKVVQVLDIFKQFDFIEVL